MSRWGKGTIISITCPTHGFVRGDHCEKCREEKAYQGPTIQTFKPMVYTDICETPILITSKRQLKEECKKHNVIAARLL
jgi:hypothetical protein